MHGPIHERTRQHGTGLTQGARQENPIIRPGKQSAPVPRGPARRSIWPVLLLSAALLLLALAGVALGRFYWSGMRGGVQQMHASIDEANRRQLLLTQQVREAQAALQTRQAELDRLQAQLGEQLGEQVALSRHEAVKHGASAADAAQQPLVLAARASLSAAQQARLGVRLDAIGRAAARLPPPRPLPLAMRAGADSRLQGARALRAQLLVAESALALADPVLLGTTVAAAQRLLLDLYGNTADARASALHRQLDALRAELDATGDRLR